MSRAGQPSDSGADPGGSGAGAVAGVLSAALSQRAVADRAEAELLLRVVEFAGLFPVVEGSDGAACWPVERTLDGQVSGAPISGVGVPVVSVLGVHEWTAAFGISHQAGLGLFGQTLELFHQLPKLWALVQDLRLPA